MRRALLAAMLVLGCSACFGETLRWTNTATTGPWREWDNAVNWDLGRVPTAADVAIVGNGGQFTAADDIVVGELRVRNGSSYAVGSFSITTTDDNGQSGDYLFDNEGASSRPDSGPVLNIDGNYLYVTNSASSPFQVINLLGNDAAYGAFSDRTFAGTINIYGTGAYDDASHLGVNHNQLVVKSGARLGNTAGVASGNNPSGWKMAELVLEDGQANLPDYGAPVNFIFRSGPEDRGINDLLTVPGMVYPQDVFVSGPYWWDTGSTTQSFNRYKIAGGDLKVARDLVIQQGTGGYYYTLYFSTLENGTVDESRDVEVGNDLLIGRTVSNPDNRRYALMQFNDSEVRIGRDLDIGIRSDAYYLPMGSAKLGGATLHLGRDLIIRDPHPTGNPRGATWNWTLNTWDAGTSTLICDGNGTGTSQTLTPWCSKGFELHTLVVDNPGGTVSLAGDAGGDLTLTGDLEIRRGQFYQSWRTITFNGPEHHWSDNADTSFHYIELAADAVVLMGSDIALYSLTMQTGSELHLEGHVLTTQSTVYEGEGQWTYGDGLIIGYIPPIPGDANDDGKVDGADLAIWQQNYDPLGLGNNTFEKGDFNGDGKIDGIDIAFWQQNYDPLGTGGLDGLGTGVPEPATLLLLCPCLLAGLGAIRHRRTK